MRNLKLILSYDGSEFAGWQVQPDAATIQGTLASAIGRLTGENVLPQGSGRTDAGVHAIAQVATFTTESVIPVENFQRALNGMLPAAIRVVDVREVPLDFHARKSARGKTYRYRMYREEVCPPFVARYVWHYPYPLDEQAIVRAAGEVLGERDFTSFAAVDAEKRGSLGEGFEGELEARAFNRKGREEELREGHKEKREKEEKEEGLREGRKGEREARAFNREVRKDELREVRKEKKEEERCGGRKEEKSNVRTIFESSWERVGEEFVYSVRGNGFLHHMVRNLVGTFLLVGKGTLAVEDIGQILEARNRSAAGPTAPAGGLCLMGVEYD
jgi:tRNA pseudouridine38-40 synthase